MSSPSFARLESGYAKLWAAIEPEPEYLAAIKRICEAQLVHKATFQAVEHATGVPWWWVAVTDQMEGGGGARTYLGNGQSLSRATTEVPAGRGPFANFVAGAVDALHLDDVDQVKDWSAERAAYQWESYNGWGYLHLPIEDPYLAAWSNKETPGKYTSDHHFDPNAMSQQPGALTILKVLTTLDTSISFTTSANGAQPKGPDMTNVTMPNIDFATLEKLVGQVLPFLTKLVPGLAPFETPIKTISNDLLQAAPGSGAHTALSIFVKDGLPMIGMFIPQLAPFMPIITGLAGMLLNATPPGATATVTTTVSQPPTTGTGS